MMTIAASDGLKLFIPQVYDIVWSLIILCHRRAVLPQVLHAEIQRHLR